MVGQPQSLRNPRTMAPFARNDKTVLEIALPALVGCKAGVF